MDEGLKETTIEEGTADGNITTESSSNVSPPTQKLSKKQQKKLAKRERWLQHKSERRAREKEKRKLKIQEAKRNGRDLGPSRKLLKSMKMADSPCKLKIIFDLSFDKEMTEAEMSKTFKQLHRCYSINRRAEAPLQLHLTGYSDFTKNQMSKLNGSENWDVYFNEKHYSEIFDLKDFVYLTSDSPNVLQELDHAKAYIIGALVDHNRLKGVCYEQATNKNIAHARLPLDLFFTLKTRTVLTIDQVFLIILKVTEGRTWQEAILDTVPKRKGVELKQLDSDSIDQAVPEKNSDVLNIIKNVNCEEISV